MENGKLTVPDHPIIPFIEGDGIGPDIWNASVNVFDSAVERAYEGVRKIDWLEILAGEKAHQQTGEWLPQETLDLVTKHRVAIKGASYRIPYVSSPANSNLAAIIIIRT